MYILWFYYESIFDKGLVSAQGSQRAYNLFYNILKVSVFNVNYKVGHKTKDIVFPKKKIGQGKTIIFDKSMKHFVKSLLKSNLICHHLHSYLILDLVQIHKYHIHKDKDTV